MESIASKVIAPWLAQMGVFPPGNEGFPYSAFKVKLDARSVERAPRVISKKGKARVHGCGIRTSPSLDAICTPIVDLVMASRNTPTLATLSNWVGSRRVLTNNIAAISGMLCVQHRDNVSIQVSK